MFKKLFVLTILLAVMLVGCRVDIRNGENYYCPGVAYFDLVEQGTVRFSCEEEEKEFEVVFQIPDDEVIRSEFREYSGQQKLGIVILDGNIIQFYGLSGVNAAISIWVAETQ